MKTKILFPVFAALVPLAIVAPAPSVGAGELSAQVRVRADTVRTGVTSRPPAVVRLTPGRTRLEASEPDGWLGLLFSFDVIGTAPNARIADVVVRDVTEEGPGYAAGVRRGDRVISINGAPAGTAIRHGVLREIRAGQQIRFALTRANAPREIVVFAGRRAESPAATTERTGLSVIRLGDGSGAIMYLERSAIPDSVLHVTAMRSDSVRRVLTVHFDSVRTQIERVVRVSDVQTPRAEGQRLSYPVAEARYVVDGTRMVVDSARFGLTEASPLRFDGTAWRVSASNFGFPTAMAYRFPTPSGTFPMPGTAWPENRRLHGLEQLRGLEALQRMQEDAAASESGARRVATTLVYAQGARAVLGAEVVPMNPGLATYFGVESGLLVADVVDGTPADQGGLRSGDVILRAGGADISTVTELRQAVERARVVEQAARAMRGAQGARGGQPLRLDIVREGRRITLVVPN